MSNKSRILPGGPVMIHVGSHGTFYLPASMILCDERTYVGVGPTPSEVETCVEVSDRCV